MKLLVTLIAAMAFAFDMAVFVHRAEPVPPDSPNTGASEVTIMGDVLMTEGELYIVKDLTGHEIRIM